MAGGNFKHQGEYAYHQLRLYGKLYTCASIHILSYSYLFNKPVGAYLFTWWVE